jgi:hypothetical protein
LGGQPGLSSHPEVGKLGVLHHRLQVNEVSDQRRPVRHRREVHHTTAPTAPTADGDVIDLDTLFDQQFLHVAIRQAEAQVPPDRDDDDLGWGPEAGKGGLRDRRGVRAASAHAPVLLLAGVGPCLDLQRKTGG